MIACFFYMDTIEDAAPLEAELVDLDSTILEYKGEFRICVKAESLVDVTSVWGRSYPHLRFPLSDEEETKAFVDILEDWRKTQEP